MSERMSDEELGKAIMAETACIPSIGDLRRAGAAARRLVHEDDLRGAGIDLSAISRSIIGAVIDKAKRRDKAILWDLRCAATFAIKQLESHLARLTAERDAAMAWYRAVEKAGSALCLAFDLTAPAEEALRDLLKLECDVAEYHAFRAGAEAMRKAAAECADALSMTYEETTGRDRGVRVLVDCNGADAIRALPLPAHKSTGDAT